MHCDFCFAAQQERWSGHRNQNETWRQSWLDFFLSCQLGTGKDGQQEQGNFFVLRIRWAKLKYIVGSLESWMWPHCC